MVDNAAENLGEGGIILSSFSSSFRFPHADGKISRKERRRDSLHVLGRR